MALVVASNVAALNTYNTLKKMIKRKRYYGRRYGKGNDRLFKEQCFAASGPVYARSGQSEQF